MNTTLSRRTFNKVMIAKGALAVVAGTSAGIALYNRSDNNKKNGELWLSAQGRESKHYGIGWINPTLESNETFVTKFRGHGLCQNPAKPEHVIMFSRRPGTEGIRLNTLTNKQDGSFVCADDRHMHGHGCYSADGLFLYCAETKISTGEGKITVRNATTLELVNEFSSFGIGPHEIALMPDGFTLVVANGGLLTHPDSGREILNLDTMRSTLSYIDVRTGKLISEHLVTEPKASIRHIDVASDGTVAIALQVQRKAMTGNELTPLAGVHIQGQEIKLFEGPEALMVKLNDYMGSTVIHNDARIAAFTSPKGDLAMFWHLDDLSFQGYHSFHDVCGLTVSQDNKYFILSNSAGKIRQINARTLKIDKQKSLNFPNRSWDNHMISVSPKRIS